MLAALFAAFCLYAELTFSVFLLFITLIIFLSDLGLGGRSQESAVDSQSSTASRQHSSFIIKRSEPSNRPAPSGRNGTESKWLPSSKLQPRTPG